MTGEKRQKVLKVIHSCSTQQHFEGAIKYLQLARKAGAIETPDYNWLHGYIHGLQMEKGFIV